MFWIRTQNKHINTHLQNLSVSLKEREGAIGLVERPAPLWEYFVQDKKPVVLADGIAQASLEGQREGKKESEPCMARRKPSSPTEV